jgi:hypothetical protein
MKVFIVFLDTCQIIFTIVNIASIDFLGGKPWTYR